MKWLSLVHRNLGRRRLRTLLTLGGVASAMMLLVMVESLSRGLEHALTGTRAARTLIVYRQNRYCPQTSLLPEYYGAQIEEMEGVESVLPVKLYLNNCRASLDLITFQGVPVEKLEQARSLDLVSGDLETFRRTRDGALVGRSFAARRGLSVGDQFRFGNINVKVVGEFRSQEPVEEAVILTHLEYLQRASGVERLGTVTLFEVKVKSTADAEQVARRIDERFRTAEDPTDTRAMVAYLESALRDLREILRASRWLGLGCVIVVLALVANTIAMSVHERVREFGVFRTLGFRAVHLVGLVLLEGLALAFWGGALGVAAVVLLVRLTSLSIGAEGVTVEFSTAPSLVALGLAASAASGVCAGLVPALRAARAPIVTALRSV